MRRFSIGSTWASPPGSLSGRILTEGWMDRFAMSTEQRQRLDAILRQGTFPAVADVNEQRRQLKALLSAQPLPADGIEPRHTVLYFHGGVYVVGDAFLAADLAPQVGCGRAGEVREVVHEGQ